MPARIDEEGKSHSVLSPSSSGRWMNCAGSVAANSGDKRTNYHAEMGTAAHNLLEMCLRLDSEPQDFIGKFIYKSFKVDEAMCDAVGHALDYVNAYLTKYPKAKLHIEKEVDPARLLNCAPRYACGTLDIALDNVALSELVMIDYKHGYVLVDVDSTQLKQYLLGYVAQYITRPYKRYVIVIVQPRGRHEEGPVRSMVLTHDELMEHAQKVKKRLVHMRKHPDERVAGKWCKFCKVEGSCKALATKSMQSACMEFGDITMKNKPIDPQELDAEELAHALKAWTTYIQSWGNALYAAALELLSKGGELPDYKLVYGRSSRFWRDEKKVAKLLLLKYKFSKDDIAPRRMEGIIGIERLFKERITVRGRKKDPLPPDVKKLVDKSKPSLHIAPEDDPRQAVRRGQEFENVPIKRKSK